MALMHETMLKAGQTLPLIQLLPSARIYIAGQALKIEQALERNQWRGIDMNIVNMIVPPGMFAECGKNNTRPVDW